MWCCLFSQVEGDGAEPTSRSNRLAPDDTDAGTTISKSPFLILIRKLIFFLINSIHDTLNVCHIKRHATNLIK